jgi:hypothetical protein
MSHRLSTWWRALGGVLLSLATMTWPAAAQAASTPSPVLTLVHQDAVAALSRTGDARISISVVLPDSPDTTLQLSLFPRLLTRSELAPITSGVGSPAAAVATTGPFTLRCSSRHAVTFDLALFTARPGRHPSPCTSRPTVLHLPCAGLTCDGVYPLSYTTRRGATTTTTWSLLAVQASAVARPLRLVWITSLAGSSWRHPASAVAALEAIAHHPAVPVTLTTTYLTLARALATTSKSSTTWRAALTAALASPAHQIEPGLPSSIDLAGLWRHHLATQVALQFSLTDQFIHSVTKHLADAPVVLARPPTTGTMAALHAVGVTDVVLPESALSVAPTTTLTWGAPFHVPGADSLLALATDSPLSQLATDAALTPGLRSVLTLDTLAFLHFEAPNAPATRTVVVDAPAPATSPTYLNDVFAGLTHNPFVVASALAPAFNPALVATNGSPATRTLVTGPVSTWSARNVTTLLALIGTTTSYAQAVTSSTLDDELRVAVASCETVGPPGVRQRAIDHATALLAAQTSQFSIDSAAITLTGSGTALPITVLSRAPYTVTAVLHLTTNGVGLVRGNLFAVTLSSPTTSVRLPTVTRASSGATLQVTLTTPNNQVVLAQTAIQVRVTATSVVGYLLTGASILVLALWWWRTSRRRSKGRHAR